MTDAELLALESLAKAATPGPWEHLPHNNKDAWIVTKYQNPESEEYICSIAIAFGDIQEKRNKDAAYITAANPAVVLELIAELRQTRKERDWLAVQVVRYNTDCPMNREWEKCNDGQYENRDEPKNNQRCIKCWLEAAKEATRND